MRHADTNHKWANYKHIAHPKVTSSTYYQRLDLGWTPERAATEEPKPRDPNSYIQPVGSDFSLWQKELCQMMKSLPFTPNLNYKMGFRG